MDTIVDFIFNWHTYLWFIPIWFCLFLIITKIMDKEVIYDDLPAALFIGIINPIINWAVVLAIPIGLLGVAIYYIYIKGWQKIKHKKIF